MFTFTLLLAVTVTSVYCSKCPEDPLACLLRSPESTSQLIAIKLQQSIGDSDASATGDPVYPPATHQHDGHLHHQNAASESTVSGLQDNRYSLNDTQGAGCGPEETINGTSGCKKCSLCPANGRVIRSCSPEHDTICMCDRGTFLDMSTFECKVCSPCPHGSGVWHKCTRHRDTVCRQCLPGFYSSVLSNDLSCLPCDTCTSNQIMLQECSPIENTVCIDRSIGKRFHLPPFAGQRKEIKSSNHANVSHSLLFQHVLRKHLREHPVDRRNQEHVRSASSNMHGEGEEKSAMDGQYYDYSTSHASLHIYFAVLVVIICCVCFYVLLQRRLHQKAKSAPFGPQVGNIYIRSSHLNSLYSPLSRHCHHTLRAPHQLHAQHIQHQYEQLQSCHHLVKQQTFRKLSKQEHKAISANYPYRLLGSNSQANRQQQQHLVLTWSDTLHPPKYLDASDVCCLPHSPYDERNLRR